MNYSEPDTPVWSLSRRRMYEFCPRSAVMYYREMPAGMKPDADALHQRIAAAGRTVPDAKFIRQFMLTVMRKQFYSTTASAAGLLASAMAEFDALIDRILLGTEFKIPMSLTGRTIGFTDGRQSLAKRFESALLAVIRSGCWEQLMEIPFAKRRKIPEVLSVRSNETLCLASPLCSAIHDGRLCMIELRSGELFDAEDEISLIHHLYTVNVSGNPAGSVRSLVIDYRGGRIREFGNPDGFVNAMRRIEADTEAWQDFCRRNPGDIPVNRKNCANCIFSEICNHAF
jgi:hypothetical protein